HHSSHIPAFPTRRSSDLHLLSQTTSQRPNDMVDMMPVPNSQWMHSNPPRKLPMTFPLYHLGLSECSSANPLEPILQTLLLLKNRSEEHTSELQSPDHLVC